MVLAGIICLFAPKIREKIPRMQHVEKRVEKLARVRRKSKEKLRKIKYFLRKHVQNFTKSGIINIRVGVPFGFPKGRKFHSEQAVSACICIWDRMWSFRPVPFSVFTIWTLQHGRSIPAHSSPQWKKQDAYSLFLRICQSPVFCVKKAVCAPCTFPSFRQRLCCAEASRARRNNPLDWILL